MMGAKYPKSINVAFHGFRNAYDFYFSSDGWNDTQYRLLGVSMSLKNSHFQWLRKIWTWLWSWNKVAVSLQKEGDCIKKIRCGASLVAQWLRICLPIQGTRVRALVWEDPTCRRATGPVSHNCWACASGACAPQQERPR